MTKKQEIFIKEYILTKNATQSAIKAGYNPSNARFYASKLLKDANISQQIEKEFKKIAEKYDWNEDIIKEKIACIVEDGETKPSDRLRGLELLGKSVGMFKDSNVNIAIINSLDEEKLSKVRDAMAKRKK